MGEYCDTCWTRVPGLTAVPCPQCCSVVYCSSRCRSESQSGWHRYECCQNIANTWSRVNDEILGGQKEITLTYHQLCYRLITQRRLQYWIDNREKHLNGDNTRGSGGGDKFLVRDYDSFFSLVSHPLSTPDHVIPIMTVSAVVMLHHLRRSGYLSEDDEGIL